MHQWLLQSLWSHSGLKPRDLAVSAHSRKNAGKSEPLLPLLDKAGPPMRAYGSGSRFLAAENVPVTCQILSVPIPSHLVWKGHPQSSSRGHGKFLWTTSCRCASGHCRFSHRNSAKQLGLARSRKFARHGFQCLHVRDVEGCCHHREIGARAPLLELPPSSCASPPAFPAALKRRDWAQRVWGSMTTDLAFPWQLLALMSFV
mmetsp:Transcript_31704/g.80052  ORF Transcript_31704/g.80052 Transcript_31704/m.80052 type:complete len:202 (-) Transcript_31704:534-1139(-)